MSYPLPKDSLLTVGSIVTLSSSPTGALFNVVDRLAKKLTLVGLDNQGTPHELVVAVDNVVQILPYKTVSYILGAILELLVEQPGETTLALLTAKDHLWKRDPLPFIPEELLWDSLARAPLSKWRDFVPPGEQETCPAFEVPLGVLLRCATPDLAKQKALELIFDLDLYYQVLVYFP